MVALNFSPQLELQEGDRDMASQRFLLVDDNSGVLDATRRQLSPQSYVELVGCPASGEVTPKQVPLLQPHLVLMDLSASSSSITTESQQLMDSRSDSSSAVMLAEHHGHEWRDAPAVARADGFVHNDDFGRQMPTLIGHLPKRSTDISAMRKSIHPSLSPHRLNKDLRYCLRLQTVAAIMGERALSSSNLASLISEAMNIVVSTLEVSHGTLRELQGGEQKLKTRAKFGWRSDDVNSETEEIKANSFDGFTLLADGPVVVQDFRTESRFAIDPVFQAEGIKCAVSLVVEGSIRPFGLLSIQSNRRRAFTEQEVDFLENIGNVLSVAVQRHQKEELNRGGDSRAGFLLAAAPAVIYSRGLLETNKGMSVSEYSLIMLGYEPRTFQEKAQLWEGKIHPHDRSNVFGAISKVQQGYQSVEYRLLRHDETYQWIRDDFRFIFDEAGTATEIVGCWTSIAERADGEEVFDRSQNAAAIGRLAEEVVYDFNKVMAILNHYADAVCSFLPKDDFRLSPLIEIQKSADNATALLGKLMEFSQNQASARMPLEIDEILA